MMILIRVLGIIMGVLALYVQFLNFVFVTLNRSKSDPKNYWLEDMGQLFTLIILGWFLVAQIRKMIDHAKSVDGV